MKQRTETPEKVTPVPEETEPVPLREIERLAEKLFKNRQKRRQVVDRLRGIYEQALGKDILVVFSPGGWGNTPWDDVQDWEQSIVYGVLPVLEKLGYRYGMAQYLRGGKPRLAHMIDMLRDIRFFTTGVSPRSVTAAEELKFLVANLPAVKLILVGASQGAAFNNAVMQKLGKQDHIFSIELGTFFPYMKWRALTDRTLAVDSNGIVRDPMCQRDLWVGTRAYLAAIGRYFKRRARGECIRFTRCINTPGHEYRWEYPAVSESITRFLTARFGVKR
ncbi:MAG: hypothetical protein Q8O43_02030 [Dehalococcoidia bacterium]|nr:hypothetical protein [Dehalococcoidia bacterium]